MAASPLAKVRLVPQPLSRSSAVAQAIAAQVTSGALPPGTRLPAERELCARFAVSRVTVRRALGELRERGLIDVEEARGWFVAQPALGEPNALMSFSEMAEERGLTPASTVVRAATRPATAEEAEELRIAPGAALFDLERVRRLDGVPVALEQSRVPLALAPALAKADLASGSLYATLRRLGVSPAQADYVLQSVAAGPREAKLLGLAAGAPLLLASARTFDATGRPIELSRSHFCGERYRFRATLFHPAAARAGGR